MATEILRYLKIALRWWWLILLGAVLAGGSAYVYTDRQPRFYSSRSTLMVGNSIYSANPNEGQLSLSRTLAQIYSRLAKQRPVLEGVIERLELEMSWYQLQGMVNTNVIWDAALLQVTVIDVHPERAQILNTAIIDELIAQSPTSQTQLGNRSFIESQVNTLQTRIETADQEIESLKVTLETLTSAADIAEIRSRIDNWEVIKSGYQSNYAQLLESSKEDSINTINVVEPASFSDFPISPNVKLNTIAGAAAGMMLMIVTIIVLEFFNDSLEWQGEDAQMVSGLPVLGAIPKYDTDDERELIFARYDLRSPEADMIRSLRTNIFLAAGNSSVRTLLVTSSSPGDGKSTTAANLAAVIASGGAPTILIDADLRRPRVNQMFDLLNMAGLAELLNLSEEERVEMLPALLLDTDIDNLRLLPAGRPPVDPTALLSSKAMSHVIALLMDRAEYIIIDGMPILIGPDASLLSNLSDATTVVIGAGKTTRSVLVKSLEQINRFGTGNLVGVIFNRIDLKRRYRYTSDYYYYSPRALPTQIGADGGQVPRSRWRRLPIPWLTPPDKEHEYLSVVEVAAYLGLGEQTVRRWCANGQLPAQKHRWRWWIRQEDVESVASRYSTQTGYGMAEKTSHQQLVEQLLEEAEVDPTRNGLEQETERKPKH